MFFSSKCVTGANDPQLSVWTVSLLVSLYRNEEETRHPKRQRGTLPWRLNTMTMLKMIAAPSGTKVPVCFSICLSYDWSTTRLCVLWTLAGVFTLDKMTLSYSLFQCLSVYLSVCGSACLSACLSEPAPVSFSRVSRYRSWLLPALTATVILILIIALGASSKHTHTHTHTQMQTRNFFLISFFKLCSCFFRKIPH